MMTLDMAAAMRPAVAYRKLDPADRPALEAHLLRLDPESRRNRFATVVSDEHLRVYAGSALAADGVAHGAFANDGLRGVAELRPYEDGHKAEAAFSVEADWRNRGVGSALFGRLIESARNRGVRRLYVACLRRNLAMQALARKFEAELVYEGQDVLGVLDPPPGTPLTVARETMRDLGAVTMGLIEPAMAARRR